MIEKNAYDVLRVARNASFAEIKVAFRRLAFTFHPDHNKDESAKAVFQEICEAYGILGNRSKRAAYDSSGGAALKEGFPHQSAQPASRRPQLDKALDNLILRFNASHANKDFAHQIEGLLQNYPELTGTVIKRLDYAKLVLAKKLRSTLFRADPTTYIDVNLSACIDGFNNSFFRISYEKELESFLEYKTDREFASVLLRELKPEILAEARDLDRKLGIILRPRSPHSNKFF
jgi:curved DNA-binding protein CbpA